MTYQFPVIVCCLALSLVASVLTTISAGNAQTSRNSLSPETLAAWRTLYKRPATTDLKNQSDKIALGKRLFNDVRLSADHQRSCASCHRAGTGFTDGSALARGPNHEVGQRNTPTLWNVRWAKLLNWDGSATSLEQQAISPITGSMELASSIPDVLMRLNRDQSLVASTRRAFGITGPIKRHHLLASLAIYQSSLVSPRTRFDDWIDGDDASLSPSERNGFSLFVGRGGCARCHSGWRLTDDKLHDIGLPNTKRQNFHKTPTLRELLSTAPYMHDGSKKTLEASVRHYSGGIVKRTSLSPNLKLDLEISETDISNLVAFLKALSAN